MRNALFGYAATLTIIGLAGYFASGRESPTALIPVAFGLVALALGLLTAKKRALAMHLAVVLAVLGLGGSFSGLREVIAQLATGAELVRPLASWSKAAMCVSSAVFTLLAIRAFVEARRNRQPATV